MQPTDVVEKLEILILNDRIKSDIAHRKAKIGGMGR